MSYLSNKFFIRYNIALRAIKSLLQEGKKDRNHDHSLYGLSEDDEEHRNSEDLGSHVAWWCEMGVMNVSWCCKRHLDSDGAPGPYEARVEIAKWVVASLCGRVGNALLAQGHFSTGGGVRIR